LGVAAGPVIGQKNRWACRAVPHPTIVELVTTEQQLREKLRKITALFEGAATSGERQAAAAAMDRLQQALSTAVKTEPMPETKFSMADHGRDASLRPFAGDTGSNRIAIRASVTPR